MISFGSCMMVCARYSVFFYYAWFCSKKMHEQMIDRVLKAPINLYFDTKPIGQIMGRFHGGFGSHMHHSIDHCLGCIIGVLESVLFSVYVIYQIAFLFPFIMYAGFVLVKRSIKSIKEVGRLRGIAHSPCSSYLVETVNGVSTIRAFNLIEQFEARNIKLLNKSMLATQMEIAVHQYFHVRVQLMTLTFMTVVTSMCIYLRDKKDPVILSMMMNYILHIQGAIAGLLYCYIGLERQMIDAEKCVVMTKIVQEREAEQGTVVAERPSWPEKGFVEFKNLSLKYRPDTPLVLKNLTFNIEAGHKIGVVGRTGAGKSTICLCLSRILEATEGSISVDGVDIS